MYSVLNLATHLTTPNPNHDVWSLCLVLPWNYEANVVANI